MADPEPGPTEPPRPPLSGAAFLRLTVLTVLAVSLLIGALPDRSGGAGALSYLVVAHRADAEGAARAAGAAVEAGGTVVQRYPQIGTVLAYAEPDGFAEELRRHPAVAAAGATRTVRTGRLPRPSAALAGASASADPERRPVRWGAAPDRMDVLADRPAVPPATAFPSPRAGRGPAPAAALRTPAFADASPSRTTARTSPAMWHLAMLGADRTGTLPTAAALRRTVTAVLDSGVDDTHPALAAAVDDARSASCAQGVPDSRPGAWRPESGNPDAGHGTHIAGTVAAAPVPGAAQAAGVAPGSRIAAVRLLGEAGQYYTENVICGFLWAADHGARVINSSYFADPWKYNCPADPDQSALITAVGRAVSYAQRQGAVVVASAGNDGTDLSGPRSDGRSPNDHPTWVTPPVRTLSSACIRLPGQLPGVVQVTALDRGGIPALYSNYNPGPHTVAAPGGDPDGGPGSQILSTWPGGGYRELSGTSMAAANTSGVAAVLAARHPRADSAALRDRLLSGAVGRTAGYGASLFLREG